MFSLPTELLRGVFYGLNVGDFCRLRRCNKSNVEYMDECSFLSILLGKYPLLFSPDIVSFNSCISCVVNRYHPFLSSLGSHDLVLKAIEDDDPVTFANVCRDFGVKARRYYPRIIVKDKKNLIRYLCCGVWDDGGIELDKKINECMISRPIVNKTSWRDKERRTFLFKYLCSLEEVKDTHDNLHISSAQLELTMERGDIETIKRVPGCHSYLSIGDLVSNYDYFEFYGPLSSAELGPNKPRLLREFLRENPCGGRDATDNITSELEKIDKGGTGNLDPYDRQVFSFLSKYVRMRLRQCDNIDDILGEGDGRFLVMVNTAVRYGRVRVLEWILTTFPRGERIGHTVPSSHIPVCSRIVLRRYNHPPFIPFGYLSLVKGR